MSEILIILIPIAFVCVCSCLYNNYFDITDIDQNSYYNSEDEISEIEMTDLTLDEIRIDDEKIIENELNIQKEEKEAGNGVI